MDWTKIYGRLCPNTAAVCRTNGYYGKIGTLEDHFSWTECPVNTNEPDHIIPYQNNFDINHIDEMRQAFAQTREPTSLMILYCL